MKDVNCPVCDQHNYLPLFTARDRLHGIEGEFTLVRCQECSLVFLNPQPSADELKAHYPPSYDLHQNYHIAERRGFRRQLRNAILRKYLGYPLEVELSGWRGLVASLVTPILKSRLASFPPFRAGRSNRILDIGCGSGEHLCVLKTLGWQVYGVEPNAQACGIGREKGLDIHCGDLMSAQFPPDFFDRIRYWHVLEHVPNPRAELIESRRLLKDDGILHIAVPVFDTLPAKFFGQDLCSIEAPRHLALYTRRSLRLLCEETGFEIRRLRFHYGTNVFVTSLCYVYETISGHRLTTRQKLRCMNGANSRTVNSLSTLGLFLLHKFSAPWCWLLRTIRQGDVIEIECSRTPG